VTLVDEFADFVGSVPYRAAALPWGEAQVWDLGAGDPVVLLHGVAGSRRIFHRVAPLLAEHRRVIVPPLRGEDRPLERVSLDDLLADVAALLDALDLARVTLLGVSLGGYLALAYGGRRDPRVTRILTIGAFASFRLRPRDRVVLALSRLVPADLAARYFASRVRRGHESRLLAERVPGLDVLNVDWAGKTPPASLRGRTRLIARRDLAPEIARIDVPLTLVHGARDKVVPRAYFERLRRLRPDAVSVLWDDEGHLAVLTNPELVARLLD